MSDFWLTIPGVHYGSTQYIFCSGSNPSTLSGYKVLHAISSVGAMSSYLTPSEPVVNSSSFQVVLAADASLPNIASGRRCVSDLFSRDPSVLGECTQSREFNTSQLKFKASGTVSSRTINAGVSAFNFSHVSYSSGVETGTVTALSLPGQDSLQVYSQEFDRGTVISDYPIVWKGRLAYLYYTTPAGTQQRYRVCYLTENPEIGLSTVTLTLAPIDAKMRDTAYAPPAPQEFHFGSGTRTNSGNNKKTMNFFEGYLQESSPMSVPSWSGTVIPLSSYQTSALYYSLSQVVQPVSGDVGIGALPADRQCTPTAPPIASSWWSSGYSNARIANISSSTLYIDGVSNTGQPTSIVVQKCLRVYSKPTSTNSRGWAIQNRTSTKVASPTTIANAEPPIVVYIGNDSQPVINAMANLSSPSSARTPSQVYFGLYWRETRDEEGDVVGSAAINWLSTAHFLAKSAGLRWDSLTMADATTTWNEHFDLTDTYSVKLAEPDVSYAMPSWRLAGCDPRQRLCQEVFGFVPMVQGRPIRIAQASLWWCAGEEAFCLDGTMGTGETLWVVARWTEDPDGEIYFERKLKCTISAVGSWYRYTIVVPPKNCPGIGDWYGHKATFRPAKLLSSASEGELIYRYLVGSGQNRSALWMPSGFVDQSSFVTLDSPFGLIDEYVFQSPDALSDNLESLLVMSGTGISFSVANGYRVVRCLLSRAMKTDAVLDIGDNAILSPPVAKKNDTLVADYEIKLPNDLTVNYSDAIVKNLYAETAAISLDLSDSESPDLTDNDLLVGARSALASAVNAVGTERITWSFSIPFELGHALAPGSTVRLTSAYTIGDATVSPPTNQLCRVLSVTQDPMAWTTTLEVQACEGGAAIYHHGCYVTNWTSSSNTYDVDDASWMTNGQTLYYNQNSAVTVSSHTATSFVASSFVYATTFWEAQVPTKFNPAADSLA